MTVQETQPAANNDKPAKTAAKKNNKPSIKDNLIVDFTWRTGTKRTAKAKCIYAVIGEEQSKDDIFIGEMKSPAVALAVVEDHNSWLEDVE